MLSKSLIIPPSLRATLEALLTDGPWFYFDQNNSGGYFTGPAKNVVIAAADQETAYSRLSEMEGFTTSFCQCCGQRWYGCDITKEDLVERLMNWADPKNWANKSVAKSDNEWPAVLICPEIAPNKAQKEPFTLQSLLTEVLAATGEAFEGEAPD